MPTFHVLHESRLESGTQENRSLLNRGCRPDYESSTLVQVLDKPVDSYFDTSEASELTRSKNISAFTLFTLCWTWLCVSAACFGDVVTLARGNHHAWSTAIQELGLTEWENIAVCMCFYIGWLVGDITIGFIANLTGRIPTLVVGLSVGGVCGIWTAVSSNWASLAASRFLAGVFLGGVDLVSYVLLTELCSDADERARAGCCMQCAFALGIAGVGVIGEMWAPDWRLMYFLTAALPSLIGMPLFLRIPESPMWLKDTIENSSKTEKCPREGWKMLLVLVAIWAFVGLTYFAMTASAGDLSPHLAINLTLMGFIEIPSYVATASVFHVLTRRDSAVLFCLMQMLVCGINFSLNHDAASSDTKFQVPLAVLAKGLCSSAFGALWVLTPEMFPTAIRTLALALCSQSARIASMVSPFALSAVRHTNFVLPSWSYMAGPVTNSSAITLMFAATAMSCTILLFMLPSKTLYDES